MNLQKTAYLLFITFCIVVILIYGQSILVPFILGLLLWFIHSAIKSSFDKISFIKNKFPNWIKHLLSFGIITAILIFIAEILTVNINHLAHSFDKYEPNIDSIIDQVDQKLKMDVHAAIKGYTGNIKFGSILKSLLASISGIISNGFMIILYFVFILLEEANFKPKLKKIFANKNQGNNVDEILERVGKSISSYIKLKTLVSLATGFMSYIALRLIGLDAPEFWAFLIFILNYIPTIGSLVGTIFPALFCLFQFGTFLPCILVISIVGLIQLFVGNFLEPKLMGSSMNISPLVTILALSIWGAIWGITGMILSVPITVVMIIILGKFESTKSIAILLSEKGDVFLDIKKDN